MANEPKNVASEERLAKTKPSLVLFLAKYGPGVPEFMRRHRDEHVRCLGQWFDVTVISEDCDFERVCEAAQAELAVFETGVNLPDSRKLSIRNARSVHSIPKIAFVNADAWCETRSGTLADAEQWGIETFFSNAVTAAEHTPIIADRFFVWPNFVEPNVFHDYGGPKIIPILITGSQDPQYPWRHKVYGTLIRQFPSLVCPHGGYASRAATRQMLHGEKYARVISASFFAPACGTVAMEVVRKHLEIPACRTCLITEDSPGLRAAGFVDMKNCVFVEHEDAADKVAYLLEHRDEFEAICDAGHELVRTRHTAAQRDQIYRWFKLHRELKPGERIVQMGPFEDPMVVGQASTVQHRYLICKGRHLRLVEEGNAAFAAGNYADAEQAYAGALRYMAMLPEAKLKLALCSLHTGRAKTGLRWIIEPIRYTLTTYRSQVPDPVEWAYLIVALICAGKLREAQRRAKQFPDVHHLELERARMVIHVLTTGSTFTESRPMVSSPSIHVMGDRTLDEWVRDLCHMLEACKRPGLSEPLREALLHAGSPNPRIWKRVAARVLRPPVLPSYRQATLQRLDNPLLFEAISMRIGELQRRILRAIKTRFGVALAQKPSSQ